MKNILKKLSQLKVKISTSTYSYCLPVIGEGETPEPVPNSEVKPLSAQLVVGCESPREGWVLGGIFKINEAYLEMFCQE